MRERFSLQEDCTEKAKLLKRVRVKGYQTAEHLPDIFFLTKMDFLGQQKEILGRVFSLDISKCKEGVL